MMTHTKTQKYTAASAVNPRSLALALTLLFIGGLVMITPLLFMFSTSLKTAGQVYDLRLIPQDPTFSNYVKVLTTTGFGRWFFNSLFIAFATTRLKNIFCPAGWTIVSPNSSNHIVRARAFGSAGIISSPGRRASI